MRRLHLKTDSDQPLIVSHGPAALTGDHPASVGILDFSFSPTARRMRIIFAVGSYDDAGRFCPAPGYRPGVFAIDGNLSISADLWNRVIAPRAGWTQDDMIALLIAAGAVQKTATNIWKMVGVTADVVDDAGQIQMKVAIAPAAPAPAPAGACTSGCNCQPKP